MGKLSLAKEVNPKIFTQQVPGGDAGTSSKSSAAKRKAVASKKPKDATKKRRIGTGAGPVRIQEAPERREAAVNFATSLPVEIPEEEGEFIRIRDDESEDAEKRLVAQLSLSQLEKMMQEGLRRYGGLNNELRCREAQIGELEKRLQLEKERRQEAEDLARDCQEKVAKERKLRKSQAQEFKGKLEDSYDQLHEAQEKLRGAEEQILRVQGPEAKGLLEAYTTRLLRSNSFFQLFAKLSGLAKDWGRHEAFGECSSLYPEASLEITGYEPGKNPAQDLDDAYNEAISPNAWTFELLEHLKASEGPLTEERVRACKVDNAASDDEEEEAHEEQGEEQGEEQEQEDQGEEQDFADERAPTPEGEPAAPESETPATPDREAPENAEDEAAPAPEDAPREDV